MAQAGSGAAEGGERDAAFVRLMAMVDEEAGHVSSLTATGFPHIDDGP